MCLSEKETVRLRLFHKISEDHALGGPGLCLTNGFLASGKLQMLVGEFFTFTSTAFSHTQTPHQPSSLFLVSQVEN